MFLHAVAMGMEQVALGWLILVQTDSPFMVGVAFAARTAPFFFLGAVSGAIADRFDRRLFLRFITLGVGISTGVMAVVLIAGVAEIWQIMLLAASLGSLWVFVTTVRQAYIYDVVGPPHALNGMSISDLIMRLGAVVGGLASGVIIDLAGVGGQYVAVSASFVVSIVFLLPIRGAGQAAPLRRGSVLRNLRGFFQLTRENLILGALIFMASAAEVFAWTHTTLLPVFARDVLQVGATGLGLMSGVRQLGGMVGNIVLLGLGNTTRKGLLTFGASIGFGLGLMAFPLASSLWLFLVLLAMVNACASCADTLYKTLMQASVPNEQRGAAMGGYVLSSGVGPIGHLGASAMAGAIGAPTTLLINGGVFAFLSLVTAVVVPRVRRLP